MIDLQEQVYELKWRNKLYEDILDAVLQGVYIINTDRHIVWFNRVIEELDSVFREEAIGKKEEAVWENLSSMTNTVAEAIRTGRQTEEQLLAYTGTTGQDMVIFTQSYPFYYEDKLKCVYSLAHYIDYSGKQLNKIAEYRQNFMKNKVRIINNTNFTLYNVVGSSNKIRELIAVSRKVALHNSPILLYGKTGTGKEIFAQGIHNASLFNKGRFVAINCAAIPENLLETIFFGSVKGAFTGSLDKPGLFEEANNGTIFLDELNSLPLSIQGKLLRVLQERQACRVGDNHNYQINCRIISATNQEPRKLVKEGILRPDLYFRLAVVTLEIPPLTERKSDILDLAKHFITKYNSEYNLHIKTVDNDVLNVFYQYSWPGNVRELEHTIAYMMNFADPQNEKLSTNELPSYLKEIFDQKNSSHYLSDGSSLQQMLEKYEKEVLEKTLEQNHWNISHTAKKLGIHREALYYRIKKFGLK
ncbi:sigma-54 interaction domain-containing protein [Sporomusa sp.]|uniref:sigma-54 interaction domain-containing protein n=1 Tax=Sporomusa sp. TaxID=2078658 RepID=UPI002D1DC310|nr:sigma 54-interacting transcriptional regulator [Sporomusa sp.]HWR42704.1 sigma 54-interacting transcriptional regulator [Sporomusa sp.]